MRKKLHLFIYTHTIIALFLCITLLANLRAAERIIPQLKGTYTPFQEGVLAEHKGLSPLMGAIAWHSGWIAGFYTWGPGQHVEVARARAGGATAAPAAAEVRKQFKLVNADKTRELLDYLFIDVEGDIQPTKLKTNPLFYIIKQSIDDPKSDYLRTFFGWIMLPQEARVSVVHLLNKFSINTTKDQRTRMLAMISGEGSTERILPSKLIKFVDDTQSTLEKSPEQKKSFLAFAQWLSEGTDELKGIVSFLQKINESFAECGPDKSYPAFVTEQILSAYWYAVQFTDQMRTHADSARTINEQMKLALPRYTQAVGIDDFKLVAYDIKLLVDTAKTCPLSIDELVLTSALFEKVKLLQIIPLVEWSHFNYRNAPHVGNCVETMLLNFFNFILYDSETNTYRLSQLPPTLAGSINANLRNFYTNPENTNSTNSSNPTVINEWLETISGLPNTTPKGTPEYVEYCKENEYTYNGITKKTNFELECDSRNVLAVINYLLGTKAKNFKELGPLLSTEDRNIKITALADGGFNTTINYSISIDFNVHSGHSFATFITKCESYGKEISVKDLDWLSYCLAAHIFANKAKIEPVQWIRYLLYGTGKNDYNFLASGLRSTARAMRGCKAIPDWLDTIFEKLTAFERHTLDPFKHCLNEITDLSAVFNKDQKFVDLVLKAMVSEDEKFDDPRTAAQNIIVFNFFLDKGFDVNTEGSGGKTALIYALENNCNDIAELVVPRMSDAAINAQDESGSTALIYALKKSYKDIAEHLVPIMSDDAINAQNRDGKTALIHALEKGYQDVAKFIANKTSREVANKRYEYGNTALMFAIQKGYQEIAKILAFKMSKTAINTQNQHGTTALIYALERNYIDIAKLLIPLTSTFDETTKLMILGKIGPLDDIEQLSSKMIDTIINDQDECGYTALMYAAMGGNKVTVEYLLSKMSDDAINAQNRYGTTALTLALERNYIDIAKLLIPRTSAFDKETKLMILGKIGPIDGIEQLSSKMIDAIINDQDECGYTALMYAAMGGNKATVEYLLSKITDAAINARNRYDKTALMYAEENGHSEIIALIENALREKTSTATAST